MANNLLYLVTNLLCTVLLVRALLQLVQADFYNPLSQTIFKICAPVVEPLSKILPSIGALNLAAIVAALAIKLIYFLVLGADFLFALAGASLQLLVVLTDIYTWGILIVIIASWVGTINHPMVRVVGQIIEPYLKPFRKLIPPIGMIDISPMVAMLVLWMIRAEFLPMLAGGLQSLLN